MKKKKIGRPKVKDGTKSYTVSLRKSERDELVKRHGSLTEAIKKQLNQQS